MVNRALWIFQKFVHEADFNEYYVTIQRNGCQTSVFFVPDLLESTGTESNRASILFLFHKPHSFRHILTFTPINVLIHHSHRLISNSHESDQTYTPTVQNKATTPNPVNPEAVNPVMNSIIGNLDLGSLWSMIEVFG